jgi:hypothetical protein
MQFQSFATGTNPADVLWAATNGDQYLYGGGHDDGYVQDNLGDYAITAVANVEFGDPYAGAAGAANRGRAGCQFALTVQSAHADE